MWSYVNHQAMNEIFVPLEVETDPAVRATLIDSIESEFASRILKEYERTCYQLKIKGWSTGQIADELGVSERKVKTFIRLHAERIGEHNPLARREPATNVIDITHLVQRSRHPAASPNRSRASLESLKAPATSEQATHTHMPVHDETQSTHDTQDEPA